MATTKRSSKNGRFVANKLATKSTTVSFKTKDGKVVRFKAKTSAPEKPTKRKRA